MKTTSFYKQLQTQYRLCKQLGISLMEVMLSLSVIAVILVMATRYYFTASDSQRINQTRAEIATLLSASVQWKLNHANYQGLSIQDLVDKKLLPQTPDMQKSEGGSLVIYNPWAQPITLTPSPTFTNATITTTTPTKESCTDLQTSFPSSTCTGTTFSVDLSDTREPAP